MTRSSFKQSDLTRAIKGALKAGLPVGSFKVVVEDGALTVLPIAANSASDPYAESAKRIREAFGEG